MFWCIPSCIKPITPRGLQTTVAYLLEGCTKNQLNVSENRLLAAMGCCLLYAFFAAFITTIPVCTHNTVNLGLLKQINGIDVSFFQWMIPGIIVGLVTLLALYMVIRLMNPIGEDKLFSDPEYFKKQKAELGKMSLGEIMSLILFLVLLVLWVLPSVLKLPEAIASWLNMYWGAIVGVIAAFILPADRMKKEALLTASDFKKLACR